MDVTTSIHTSSTWFTLFSLAPVICVPTKVVMPTSSRCHHVYILVSIVVAVLYQHLRQRTHSCTPRRTLRLPDRPISTAIYVTLARKTPPRSSSFLTHVNISHLAIDHRPASSCILGRARPPPSRPHRLYGFSIHLRLLHITPRIKPSIKPSMSS